MSDSYSEFCRDIEWYEFLCDFFKEEVQKKNKGDIWPDCYGEHAKSLEQKYNENR